MMGEIVNIQRFSLHDGPGIRTTVFFKGCPLSCYWCHNPETMNYKNDLLFHSEQCADCLNCVELCPKNCLQESSGKVVFDSSECDCCGICVENCITGALRWSAYTVSDSDIIDEISKDRLFYEASGGGVTLSGGEPVLQDKLCYEIAINCKKRGIHVALDTSGCASESKFLDLISVVDLVLFDIKLIDETSHKKYTFLSNKQILNNFKLLTQLKKEIIVRVPLIPKITDTVENLKAIEAFVRNHSKTIEIQYIPFNYLLAEKYKRIGRPLSPSLLSITRSAKR